MPLRRHALVQVLGEMQADGVLRARACRPVDGLSLDTWDRAVHMQRAFLERIDKIMDEE